MKIQYPDHNAIFNNSASFKVHTTPIPDGAIMKFNANKSYKNVELPFILYNHMYKVTLDGHKVDTVIGPHSLVQLNNLKKGHHTVKVVYSNIKLNIMKIISYVLCATGLVLLIKPDWITRLKKS
ncbi:MAG: hypothetical protein Q3959_01565 [Limosilactobacillus sp.]|uniref:hypothetical protein n=1 Tax=Limosilactobacillus sp. TaxID=2773925 RepID=UPI0026FBDCD4|nr:hypothetical protein [Limosilactobacillus sp.]